MVATAWAFAAAALLLLGTATACGYDPDVDLPTPGIIRRHGYPAESHTVLTDDGYLLTLHRIPQPRLRANSSAVLLQHGLFGSSADWVLLGPGSGLAYRLWDAGYDVWLGNARGNTYSRAHVKLSAQDNRFWDFSWHEMGVYDLPAEIDHVLDVTGCQQVFYVGHSMGTTMFYVLGSERPEYNTKVHAMFSLAPIAFMERVKSPIRYFAPVAQDLEFFLYLFGHGELLPQSKALRFLSKITCELISVEERICEDGIFFIVGFDAAQFNTSLLPVLLGHSPAGASTKTLAHYAQEIESGKFRQLDLGRKGNLVRYGSPEPPEYDLSKVRAPVSLHYAKNDWLANVQDVAKLYSKLPNKLFSQLVSLPSFNHLDFILGKDAPALAYDKVQQLMNKLRHTVIDVQAFRGSR